jgi:hypothetical protein
LGYPALRAQRASLRGVLRDLAFVARRLVHEFD